MLISAVQYRGSVTHIHTFFFILLLFGHACSMQKFLCLCLFPPELKYLGNGSSLPVLEGESLCLVCVVDSTPPATLSWARRGRTLSPSQPWNPGVLQLPRVESGHEGEFTCGAQHLWGSVHGSLHLSVQSELGGGKTPRGRGCSGPGEGRGPLTHLLPPRRPPEAAGSLLLLGG